MPAEFLLGMDYIPSYGIAMHWGSNKVSMSMTRTMLAPGQSMPVDRHTGRELRTQWVPMYTQYRTMHLAYTA